MDEQQPAVPVVAVSGPTWDAKEIYSELKADLRGDIKEMKGDIGGRLDRQDTVLEGIDRRLDSTVTKEDLREGLREAHDRIDDVERRVEPLEAAAAATKAVVEKRVRFRTNLAWLAGLVGAAAMVAAVVVGVVVR